MRMTRKNRELIRLYLRERKQGTLARWALRNAKTRMEWDKKNGQVVGEYERHHSEANRGDVRLRIVADDCVDLDNLFGDTFNPDVNTDIHPQSLEHERQEEIERVNRDGVWGIVAEFFDGEKWQHADSCFGFIGEDWKDSGYDTDIMASTLEQAKNTRICRACKRPLKREARIQ